MGTFVTFRAGTVLALCLLTATGARAADLTQPDCDRIAEWAAGYDAKATVDLRPSVTVNALFSDNLTVPLFGKPATAWRDDDLKQINLWIFECRQAAYDRKDNAAGKTINQALRALKSARRPLGSIERALLMLTQKVDYLTSASGNTDMTTVLALARHALTGKDVEPEVQKLPRESLAYGREVLELARYRPMVCEEDVAPLLEKLEKQSIAAAETAGQNQEALKALQAELAAIPASAAGLGELNGFAYHNAQAIAALPRSDQEALDQAAKAKAAFIRQVVQNQKDQATQAKVAQPQTATPVTVVGFLEKALPGDSVGDVALRGLRPGIPYKDARSKVLSDWGYRAGTGGELLNQFAPTRREMRDLMAKERHDGGVVEFDTMDGNVGKVMYMHHFSDAIDIPALRVALTGRFGAPATESQDGKMTVLEWNDDGMRLRVGAGSMVQMIRKGDPVRSSIIVVLESQDYVDYLAEARARCAELRNKPTEDLTGNEKQAILTGCRRP